MFHLPNIIFKVESGTLCMETDVSTNVIQPTRFKFETYIRNNLNCLQNSYFSYYSQTCKKYNSAFIHILKNKNEFSTDFNFLKIFISKKFNANNTFLDVCYLRKNFPVRSILYFKCLYSYICEYFALFALLSYTDPKVSARPRVYKRNYIEICRTCIILLFQYM